MKLTGVFVLVACVLAGCDQVPISASTTDPSTTASGTTSPPAPIPPSPPPPPISPPPPPPPPPPTSGTATLSWLAPTTNTDGAALTDLAGYVIYYGTSATALSGTIQLTSVGLQSYVIPNLTPGTWYFAVKALASTGAASALSLIVSNAS